MDDAAAGLVGGKHQHLGYLHMLWRRCCIERYIGYVVALSGLTPL